MERAPQRNSLSGRENISQDINFKESHDWEQSLRTSPPTIKTTKRRPSSLGSHSSHSSSFSPAIPMTPFSTPTSPTSREVILQRLDSLNAAAAHTTHIPRIDELKKQQTLIKQRADHAHIDDVAKQFAPEPILSAAPNNKSFLPFTFKPSQPTAVDAQQSVTTPLLDRRASSGKGTRPLADSYQSQATSTSQISPILTPQAPSYHTSSHSQHSNSPLPPSEFRRLIDRNGDLHQSTGQLHIRKRIQTLNWLMYYRRDWFHSIVDAPTNRIILLLMAVYLSIVFIFAGIYSVISHYFFCNLGEFYCSMLFPLPLSD